MGYYQIGQACRNGHPTTGNADHDNASPFCPDCGEVTITACEHCQGAIRGNYYSDMSFSLSLWVPPQHCYQCGAPYPWTARKLAAAKEMADAIEELTDHEREQLVELMPHLIQETPRTSVAGFKVGTIWAKIKGPGKEAFKDVLMDIAVDAGKKALGFG